VPVLKYPPTGDPRVTIAITTFRRESQLGALLATVQERIAELPPSVRVRTLVIDNDPAKAHQRCVESQNERVHQPAPKTLSSAAATVSMSGAAVTLASFVMFCVEATKRFSLHPYIASIPVR